MAPKNWTSNRAVLSPIRTTLLRSSWRTSRSCKKSSEALKDRRVSRGREASRKANWGIADRWRITKTQVRRRTNRAVDSHAWRGLMCGANSKNIFLISIFPRSKCNWTSPNRCRWPSWSRTSLKMRFRISLSWIRSRNSSTSRAFRFKRKGTKNYSSQVCIEGCGHLGDREKCDSLKTDLKYFFFLFFPPLFLSISPAYAICGDSNNLSGEIEGERKIKRLTEIFVPNFL